jgi:diguanylate cyclase (GGDEF)-like protein
MKNIDTVNNRVLVIDDTESIHRDFRTTLIGPARDADVNQEAEELFGTTSPKSSRSVYFEMASAMQGQEGLAKVREALEAGRPYAVAFVDMRMPPGWDGVQTIENLWKADPDLQVVICTAYADYSWDEIMDRLGANDRLLILKKPFDTAEVRQLAMALTEKWGMTRRAMLKLDELERLVSDRTAELLHHALHDSLTGLPNRAGLSERLRAVIERCGHGRGEYALLFLDFDRFKLVNDSLGHEIGDQLLVCISRRLRAALSEAATETLPAERTMVARLGGDEFVVLIEAPGAHALAIELADRLLEALRPSYDLLGHEVFSTASVGITTNDFDYFRPEDALRDADVAMYSAKSAGKDRYVVFDRSMHDQTLTRLQLETDLRNAVGRGELRCAYQPIVAFDPALVAGFEVLMRWDHPRRGAVQPDDFIPIAEDTGLILPMGQWILQSALRQLAHWRQYPGAESLFVSVNLSKFQLSEPGFVQSVADLLRETGVPPACLKLEVTETAIMDRKETVGPILKKLRDLGVSLWMDDFGTGHSSLNCIHTFPLDGVKIDRAFIRNIESSSTYSAVVQAIVMLARNLHLTVVAEGIETPQQMVLVQALECDQGQGWLFSKPLWAEDCEALIRDRRRRLPMPGESETRAGTK